MFYTKTRCIRACKLSLAHLDLLECEFGLRHTEDLEIPKFGQSSQEQKAAELTGIVTGRLCPQLSFDGSRVNMQERIPRRGSIDFLQVLVAQGGLSG